MLPHYIPPLGVRYEKMNDQMVLETSSAISSQEKDQEQVEICDYGAKFREYLYSQPVWYAAKSTQNSMVSCTLPKSFSPVYNIGKEPFGPPESRHKPLKIEELYSKKETPFEWTDEYKEPDLERKIDAYNSLGKGMEITLHDDGINFGGHINVNMNLREEIRVVEGVVPPAVHGVTNTSKPTDELTPLLTITSLNLPPNTTEAIYIDNKTTTRQMIVKLFKKLRMINYPNRFALYEYEPQIDESAGTLTKKLARISDDACPLKVVISWPTPHSGRALVLMENECAGYRCGTSRIPSYEIVSKITGLKEEQVDSQWQKNPQTGYYETTYSKRNTTSKLCGANRKDLIICCSVTFVCCFVTIFAILIVYLVTPPDYYSERNVFERQFPKRFAMEYLQEFFEDFLKNKDLGTCNRPREL